jgi:hypothetical protein
MDEPFLASGAPPMKPIRFLLDTILGRIARRREPSLYLRCLAVHLHSAGALGSLSP